MNSSSDPGSLKSLVESLRTAASRAEKDDLQLLAKMHGWCEALAKGAGGGGGNLALAEKAGSLVRSIESLILGEVRDPAAALLRIVEMVGEVCSLAESRPDSRVAAEQVDVNTPGTPAGQAGLSEDGPGHLLEMVEELTSLASCIDQNDEQTLRRMHGLCEAFANRAAESSTPSPLAEHAVNLAQDLEQLILHEVNDTDIACWAITQAVNHLSDMVVDAVDGGPGAADCEQAKEPAPAVGDGEVAADLDKVFEAELPQDGPRPQSAEAGASAAPSTAPSSGATVSPEDAASTGMSGTGSGYQPEPLIIDDKELEFIRAFVEEAGEHIENIETALLDVQRAPTSLDKINDLFRPFHTIRSMAGFLRLRDVNSLTHEVETVLDQTRRGKRPVTGGLIDLVFDVVDILKVQVASLGTYLADPTGQAIPQPPVADMIQLLRDTAAGRIEPEARATPRPAAGRRTGESLVEQGAVAGEVVDFALEKQKEGGTGDRKIGKILMDLGAVNARQVSQALRAQGSTIQTPPQTTVDTAIRIDTDKLDSLVDAVGDLVIAQTLVQANGLVATDPKLSGDVDQVTRIIRHIQQAVTAMRTMPSDSTP